MGNAGIDEYRATLAGIECRAVSRVHQNIWVGGEILSSPSRQARIHFTGRHAPACANHFRHDRGVITDAATQVVNAVARRKLECVDPPSQRAWLPVVQITAWIEGNQDVVIKVPGIVSG